MENEINAGVKLLDKKLGRTWVFDIELERLDLGSPSQCVLGQLFDDFAEGRANLDLDFASGPWPEDCGFEPECSSQFDALTVAWIAKIKRLRNRRTP